MRGIFFPSSKPRFIDCGSVVSKLRKIASRAAGRNRRIKEIYLFGSYAHGDAGLRSDADILVVVSSDRRRMMDRLGEFMLEFSDAPVPVDVLVHTQDELDRSLREGNRFMAQAVSGTRLL